MANPPNSAHSSRGTTNKMHRLVIEVDGSSESQQTPTQDPPDGGWFAWAQVVAGHLAIINTWGYISSFGIFEPYYEAGLGDSRSQISWIGSTQIFLVYILGIVSGQAVDRGYFRVVLAIGLSLQVLAICMTSISQAYWQLLLSQGIVQGIGDGLVYCPIMALISTYFSRRRVLAISVTACGTATGGLIFPAVARQLLPQIGFAWTVRVMALIALFNALTAIVVLRSRIPPRRKGSLVEVGAFKELSYTLFVAGSFAAFWAVYFAYYYIRQFAKDVVGASQAQSFDILMVINSVGVPGRLLPALVLNPLLGPTRSYTLMALLSAVLLFAWNGVSSFGGLLAWCAVYGLVGGGVQSLFPAALATLTEDQSKVGGRLGAAFAVIGIASLTGPPLAGALIDMADGKYLSAQIFGGVSMLCGASLLFLAWCCQKKEKNQK